ncbi:MAG: response regulator transcription factor [Anaerolineales bacterium]|nr:MAG: response regulator transcription factor [Anaerolineales bacterium]
MPEIIRILIVDDHPVVREGLRGMLSHKPGLLVVGDAADEIEAIQKTKQLNPDIVLLDLVMPNKNGLDVIKEIKQHQPETRILVLTSFSDEAQIIAALNCGAEGYLLKESTPKMLLEAITAVSDGQSWLHPTIAHKVILNAHRLSTTPAAEILTKRELEVLKLVARGISNRDIADALYISESTVRVHVSNITDKLNLDNRIQIALYAVQEGIVVLD